MSKQLIFSIFLIYFAKDAFSTDEGFKIETLQGPVMGRHAKSYEGRTYLAFEGIPYAKPPVGNLRFKEPQPADPWTETLVANNTYVCMQYTMIMPMKSAQGVEDCLYLYVYVPRDKITGDENLNFVVHIHGGAFIIGDPASLAGPKYIMDRDVVYVSMNYRLGILGFFSTDDEVAPGNNGLKDQTFALKWIKDNIKLFGGNPDSVTLTGISAGGVSVHHHYFSPLSKGLFHRGVSQSGSALDVWALTRNPLQNAKKLGQLFNCSTESTNVLVDCLRSFSAKEITAALGEFLVYINALPTNLFAPVIEHGPGAFLPDHPYKLLVERKFSDLPWVAANVIDEGIVPVGIYLLFNKLPDVEQRWDEILPFVLNYYDTAAEADKPSITKKIREHYLGNATVSTENVFEHMKIYGDRLFLVDAERAIRLQAKVATSPVYYYLFKYLIDIPVSYKAKLPVVAHGDDGRLLFNQHDNPKTLSEKDQKMKDMFLDFLYNFATKGKVEFNGAQWEAVSPTDEKVRYLEISSLDDIHMTSANEIGEAAFWDSLPLKENQHLFPIK